MPIPASTQLNFILLVVQVCELKYMKKDYGEYGKINVRYMTRRYKPADKRRTATMEQVNNV
jgi:hypothetical protein